MSERMRLDSSGNLGIGTSSPIYSLDVRGEAGLEIYNASGGGDVLNFRPSLGDSNKYNMSISSYDHSGGGVGPADGISINAYDGVSIATGSSTARQERMRIDSSGNLLVGTTSTTLYSATTGGGMHFNPNGPTTIARTSNAACLILNKTNSGFGPIQQFRRNGTTVGEIQVSTSSTSYNTSSDYRLKENVVPLTGATERLKQLNPTRFNFISDADTTVDGFLAHEVSDIVPEAITGTKDGTTTEEYVITPAVTDESGEIVTEAVIGTREVPEYQGIDQSKLVPLLVATIQELEARITALEAD